MRFWLIVVLTIGSFTYVAVETEDRLGLAITSNLQGMQGSKRSAFAYVSVEKKGWTQYEGENSPHRFDTSEIRKTTRHPIYNGDSIKTKKEALDPLDEPQLMKIEQKAEREKRAWDMLDTVIANIPHKEDRCQEGKVLLSLRTAVSKRDNNVSLALANQWISYVQNEYCWPINHSTKDMDFSPKYFSTVNG
jgi:hypothetical protein